MGMVDLGLKFIKFNHKAIKEENVQTIKILNELTISTMHKMKAT